MLRSAGASGPNQKGLQVVAFTRGHCRPGLPAAPGCGSTHNHHRCAALGPRPSELTWPPCQVPPPARAAQRAGSPELPCSGAACAGPRCRRRARRLRGWQPAGVVHAPGEQHGAVLCSIANAAARLRQALPVRRPPLRTACCNVRTRPCLGPRQAGRRWLQRRQEAGAARRGAQPALQLLHKGLGGGVLQVGDVDVVCSSGAQKGWQGG